VAVLGVDACRTGWAGILLEDDGSVRGVYAADIAALASRAATVAKLAVIAIDMPIGLPDTGQRAADALARAAVGPRWRSVFMTPVRPALREPTHTAASRRSHELAGGGISQQAFALRGRIMEVDEWARGMATGVIEVHPEVCFATLAGTHVRDGKKSWAGAALRRRLLDQEGILLGDDLGQVGGQAAVDDVLDAAVAAWSARRYAAGTARSYPDPPEVFSDGYPSAIWA
jgi:predicted RNase H-like nuclease